MNSLRMSLGRTKKPSTYAHSSFEVSLPFRRFPRFSLLNRQKGNLFDLRVVNVIERLNVPFKKRNFFPTYFHLNLLSRVFWHKNVWFLKPVLSSKNLSYWLYPWNLNRLTSATRCHTTFSDPLQLNSKARMTLTSVRIQLGCVFIPVSVQPSPQYIVPRIAIPELKTSFSLHTLNLGQGKRRCPLHQTTLLLWWDKFEFDAGS